MNVSRWLLLLWISLTLPLNGAMAASMAFCAAPTSDTATQLHRHTSGVMEDHHTGHDPSSPSQHSHLDDASAHAQSPDLSAGDATDTQCSEGCQQCDLCSMAVMTSAVIDMPRLAPLTLPGRLTALPETQHTPRPLLRPPLGQA